METIRITEEQKKAIKKQFPDDKFKVLELPMDDLDTEYMEVIVRIPSRNVMGQYMKYSDQNPKKAQDILIKHCLLTNKELVLTDDALATSTVLLLAELLPIREGRIKNF